MQIFKGSSTRPFYHPNLKLLSTNTRRLTNIGLMMVHRLRRWPNIKPIWVQRRVHSGTSLFTGNNPSDCVSDDCHQLYRKYLDKDQNMTSLCDHVFTMGAISLADCQVRACDYDANVISYSADDVTGQDGLCVVRKCQNGDLRLSSLHGGWNIHISKDMLGSDGKFPVNSKNGPGGIASLPPANVALALVSRGEPVAQSGGTVSVGMVILLTLIFSILVVSLAGAVFFSYNRFKERFGGFGYYRQDKQDDQMPVDIDQDNQYNNDAQPF